MIEFRQENHFDFSSGEYADIFAASGATAFQSPTWLENFYEILAPHRGAEKLVITLRKKEELLGVVPLIRRTKSGLTLIESTDLGVSDYASPVLTQTARAALQKDPTLAVTFINSIGPHDMLRIQPALPDHASDWQSLILSEPEDAGFGAHAVDLSPPFEQWRKDNLDRKLSSMVARKGKRWKKQHQVVLQKLEIAEDFAKAIKCLVHFRKGRFDGDPIQTSEVEKFYAAVAREGGGNGLAETWVLSSDNSIAGILFGLTHQGRFYYLLIGADYDNHGRHSPGLQMYDWIIEDWMARGGTSFDFTIGDEPFKMQFGTHASQMSRFLRPNSLKGRLALTLFGGKLRRTHG
ncbi:MAG: GNAT family N-acetyltransferase [Rhizobiaceae bacterium]|nr:GNAT family N-acetyltransferase [Rhizobiaceae bacterium]